MKHASWIAAAFLLAAGSAQAADKELLFYNWTNYTSPELIKKFEAETGIKVTLDTYDSNETLLAKLRAGGAGYDLAVASSDFVPILIEKDLIRRIDASSLPDYKNISARWRDVPWDRGNAYTIPWNWGFTSAAVDTAVYKGPTDTLKPLFEPPPELAGKLGMFGSPSEVASLGLVYLGHEPCAADVAALKELDALLQKQKPAVKVYNSDGGIERMSSGETPAAQMWSGASLRARLAKPSIRYIFPREGIISWMDNVVVPKNGPNPESAKAWIAFMLKPENAALQSNFTGYQNGIDGSERFMKPEFADAPEFHAPSDIKVYFTLVCPEAATRAYDRIWTHLRQ